uniref:Nudix hydrolase domain-containing protein n=1 Tax=Pinguiococcus pyrenoidosus TaxID=172671 RepID=A0A7R9YDZ4_9STRA
MDTITKQQLMQQFLQRVDENRDMKGLEAAKDFKPLRVEGFAEPVGFVPAKMAPRFAAFEHVFQLGEDGGLLVLPSLKTMEQRTEAVREVTGVLREEGLVKGWRDELVVVTEAFDAPPAFLIERACLPIIGARGYGVHINGYVEDPATGEILLWVATRAKDKPTWPGMLDHIVAGQQPYGLSPMENVVKECYEEAGIAEPLAKAAVAVGAVSYNTVNSNGELKRDALFCFDLKLPSDFVPQCQDGEVESFELWPLSRVASAIAGGEANMYKPNCNLVVLDFLVRQGYIEADWPLYLRLVASLRNPTSQ